MTILSTIVQIKQIEVASIKLDEVHNNAYIKVVSVKANPRKAKIVIDISSSSKLLEKL